jgi:hypothetical protein
MSFPPWQDAHLSCRFKMIKCYRVDGSFYYRIICVDHNVVLLDYLSQRGRNRR